MNEDPLATFLVLVPLFVIVSFISSAIIGMKRLRSFRPFFIILVVPGIVLHEISHYLMCKLVGANVERISLIEINRRGGFSGHVGIEPIQNSFVKPFLVAVAPALINTTLACVLILVYPYLTITWTKLLICWLVACLVLGCRPSFPDLAIALGSIAKYPRSFLREMSYLGIGILFGLVLWKTSPAIIGIELPPLLATAFSLLAIILAYVILKGS
jgi:hypothetical protein